MRPLTRFLTALSLVCMLPCGMAMAQAVGATVSGSVTVVDLQGQPKTPVNVVVFIDGLTQKPAPLAATPSMRQVKKKFEPRVLVVPLGTTVDFPNEDAVLHNVFSLSTAKPFDLGLFATGTRNTVTFDKLGTVRIYCNIHPEMISDILVVPNNHYVMVDSSGTFTIPGVPAGPCTVRAWFPDGPSAAQAMTISAGKVHPVKLALRETNASTDHTTKNGEPYPLDY